MTENEMKKLSKFIAEDLKKEKMFKSKKDSYEKTEYLLYKYNQLPEAIRFLKEEVKSLEDESKKIPRATAKSPTLVLKENEGNYIYGDEILMTRISELKQIIAKTRSYKRMVDKVLKKFKEDEYYPIIEWIYFKNKTFEDIANEFGWATGTISKHKSRLINEIKVYLFPDNFLNELGTWEPVGVKKAWKSRVFTYENNYFIMCKMNFLYNPE